MKPMLKLADEPIHSLTTSSLQAASLRVEKVSKTYGRLTVLDGIDLLVRESEFLTLLGSSGSGKTTLLRIIAGLTDATSGRVMIGERDVTAVPIEKRDIGFVFQNYALFPHLNVSDNIAFGLKIRKQPVEQIRSRVEAMLKLVHLEDLASRLPSELSGGQQQRVAIARALAPAPKLLLLDEPLGALDRRLRQKLGADLRKIQKETGVTAIYVTHDQEEAFLLSDRIAVMEDGKIRQLGSPLEIYQSPDSLFVANFVGETTLMYGRVASRSGELAKVDMGSSTIGAVCAKDLAVGSAVIVAVRPEDVRLQKANAATNFQSVSLLGHGTITSTTFLGSKQRLEVAVGDVRVSAELDSKAQPEFKIGDAVDVSWEHGAARAYHRS